MFVGTGESDDVTRYPASKTRVAFTTTFADGNGSNVLLDPHFGVAGHAGVSYGGGQVIEYSSRHVLFEFRSRA
eukprot:2649245-Rhodomonas_salina.1